MIRELDDIGYNEILENKKTAVVEFYSRTCPHCKKTEAGLKELIQESDQKQTDAVEIGKCNIAEVPALVSRLDIQALPTLLFIKDGRIVNRKTGFTHKLVIQEEIKKLLNE